MAMRWACLLVALALATVVVSGEADGELPSGQVQYKLGEREAGALRDATLAAKESLENAKASGSSRDAAEAMGALANVETLTEKLNVMLRQRKKNYVDPMAHVRVNSDPKKESITFPALGLKMNTETVVDPVDGTPGPASITAEVMGSDVAKERKKLAKQVSKETAGEMAKFGNVNKILAKNGFGRGFGRLHTRPATMDDKKETAEAEAKDDRKKARSLLRKSLKTRKSVKKAIATMFDLKKQEAKDRLDAQKQRHADAKARKELHMQKRQELESMYDRIKSLNDDFRSKFGLDAATASPADTAAKEAAKAAMPKQPKAKSAKRRAAKLDKALSVERSKAEKLLAKAKARTMSHNEKTATAASAGDVQAKMDKAEREEVQAQASKSMSPTFDSERQMEKEMIARAAEATSQVEEMEMGEGVHELQ